MIRALPGGIGGCGLMIGEDETATGACSGDRNRAECDGSGCGDEFEIAFVAAIQSDGHFARIRNQTVLRRRNQPRRFEIAERADIDRAGRGEAIPVPACLKRIAARRHTAKVQLELLGVAAERASALRTVFEAKGFAAACGAAADLFAAQPLHFLRRGFPIASLRALAGQTDEAFAILDAAAARGDPTLMFFPWLPFFDALKGDPRYEPLASRVRVTG